MRERRMKRDSYMTARIVRRELARLGLDKAERILVKTCGDCPCCSDHDHGLIEYHCTMLDTDCHGGRILKGQFEPPPHDCPLRTRALSIAIDPEV